jgi:hypothetical protein
MKVTSQLKKAAVSKATALPTNADDVTSAQTATVNAALVTKMAPTKPKTTKQEQVLTMLSQVAGTMTDEIVKATGWQQHSVCGFFAGALRKKLGFELTSEKEEDGVRRYAIKVAA